MSIEQSVTRHYRHGALEQALLKGLAAAGKDADNITADDLAPVDEFHIGGRQATVEFAAEFGAKPGMHLIDIGSGLGGPSRYFAQHHGCTVTGVDLSEEYVAVAAALTRRVGLSDRVTTLQASALALPFPPAMFDGAYLFHVGMNISDKARLFSEVHRVLKPGGRFGVYDVMRGNDGALRYPVPWASSEQTNFIATPAAYRALLTAEGFQLVKERNRRQFALDFFHNLRAKAANSGGPPAFGMQIVLGPTMPQKVGNLIALLEGGTIAPVEMFCRVV